MSQLSLSVSADRQRRPAPALTVGGLKISGFLNVEIVQYHIPSPYWLTEYNITL